MRISRPGRNDATTRPSGAGDELTLPVFSQLAGTVGGYPYVKIVIDRTESTIHFIDSTDGILHVHYIARDILGISIDELALGLDSFNDDVYRNPDRRFYLGTLALHTRQAAESERPESFLSLETVDVDTMSEDMLRFFYHSVRDHVDRSLRLFLKPANHVQEGYVADIPESEIPRILSHELYGAASFVSLNPGSAHGRLRVFRSEEEYRADPEPLKWHDILVMPRVPEDIPRVSGLISAEHTTPLSHVNVMAAGWQIPNAVRLGILDRIDRTGLDGQWVGYRVDADAHDVLLEPAEQLSDDDRPRQRVTGHIVLDRPELAPTPITSLSELRVGDHCRFGTKAANLGEICDLLQHGSPRWFGFYRVPRPPRKNLLRYLARQLGVPGADDDALTAGAGLLMKEYAEVPRGIVLPFSLQQRFLESSPEIRQSLTRLKKELEPGTPETDELCLELQQLIRTTPVPDGIRTEIDRAIVRHLSGVPRFVARSSSNAEDLPGFSAAGLYHSVPDLTGTDAVLDGIREVWASLLSPRAVALQHEAGIPLDRCYMGVIVQEQVGATTGGVLVTWNPLHPQDFRNVYLNISQHSVTEVVSGEGAPLQYLCNTVEGGSRTVSLGSASSDLDAATKDVLCRLALMSRLLQSHFAPDDTFAAPVDIEWAIDGDRISLLQLRPFQTAA
ncbi:PEP/pyruvate-binding domain-containing protein [Kitasatospora sp. NPDC056138]|uniref:PEP/pyruvate-binding domain-containing protein n=1 Tax=Kitasatospora sp. NPDC056138 TaxID=3345724 RepID=UPI0035D53D6B